MIAQVVYRRGSEHQVRPQLAQQSRDAAARRIVVEDGQVTKFGATVPGADQSRSRRALPAADFGDGLRTQIVGAAVARRHGHDGYFVALAHQQGECPAGQDLGIVRMRVNGNNPLDHRSIMLTRLGA
jgi:hypothetical protein